MRRLDGVTDSTDTSQQIQGGSDGQRRVSKFREVAMDRDAWCAAVHGVAELDTT